MREPLLPPLAALAAGITVSRFVEFEYRELLAAASALLVLAFIARRFGTPRVAVLCLLPTVFFGGVALEILHRPGPPPLLDAEPREIVILSGCVVTPSVFHENREQFVLELASRARARVSLYMREGEQPPNLRYGQLVDVEARVRAARNFGNPGSFDYAGYLARQHIYWTAYASPGAEIQVLEGKCGNWFRRTIFGLRTAALERLSSLYGDEPFQASMLPAMLFGDKSRLERAWTDHFRNTGTYHTLVISGLHLTVLAAVVLFVLRLFSFGEGTVLVAGAAAAWLYALVTGGNVPVVRAASGLTLYLLARFFYRRHRLLNLLAAVALGFLLFDPHQLFEASFQLSFLCVAAIAALAMPLLEKTAIPLARGLSDLQDCDRDIHLEPRTAQFRIELRLLAETLSLWTRAPARWVLLAVPVPARLLFYVFGLVTVSAAVQIGVALPMASYFHRVSFSGVSANVFVMPLMSLLVPIGFAAILTGWSAPASVAAQLLEWTQKVVEWHAGLEPAWRIPSPPLWLAISFSASLVLLAAAARGTRWWRWAATALTAACFVVLIWHPFAPKLRSEALEFTAIDVGQGDSFFLALPEGRLMVMDGGGIPGWAGRRSRLDPGEDVVAPYLWSRSIRRLDVVAMSHAHEDHMGGLFALIDNFRPSELWTGAVPDSPIWYALRDKARERGVTVRNLGQGQRFHYGGAEFEALAPLSGHVTSDKPSDRDSLVLRIAYGRHSLLLTGDADRQLEAALVERNPDLNIDILKVAHHGSRSSSSDRFLAAARPAFAVASLGYENAYNHPHPEVVARLEQHRATFFRTDVWGMITIRTDGRSFEVDTARWSGTPRRLLSVF